MISDSVLGKFKLEYIIKKAHFMAAKNYILYDYQNNVVSIKCKGAAKDFADEKWYEEQYLDPTREVLFNVKTHFRIDHNKLLIKEYNYDMKLRSEQYIKQ